MPATMTGRSWQYGAPGADPTPAVTVPSLRSRPSFSVPVDGETENAASILPAFQTLADHVALLSTCREKPQDLVIYDDFFTLSTASTSSKVWIGGDGIALTANNANGNNANGAIEIIDTGNFFLQSAALYMPNSDWTFTTRIWNQQFGDQNHLSQVVIGLKDDVIGGYWFFSRTPFATWHCGYGGSSVDSGVVMPPGSWTQLEIRRISNNAFFFIDGTLVAGPIALATTLLAPYILFSNSVGANSTPTDLHVDMVRLWVAR